jgi:RNA polymerase sigma-70 factor (sigma-E family)
MTFEGYVRAQRPALLRFATVLAGDGYAAEDLVQIVLGKAYQRWDRIASIDFPHAYVRRMVVNEFLSWRRRLVRAVPTEDLDVLLPHTPDHADAHAQHLELLHLVNGLPKRQRAAVVLRYYEGLSDQEIATALGCGVSTVRSNLSRALASLRVAAQPASAGCETHMEAR